MGKKIKGFSSSLKKGKYRKSCCIGRRIKERE